MDPIKVGVIGVGSLGQHHARVYAELPEASLVAVADTKPARAAEIAGRHGCLALTDFRALLGQVEAVSVVVPTLRHHAITRECLEAGLHVLVEKPLAATVQEAHDLTTLASNRGLVLQVGHIERFNSAVRATMGAVKVPTLIECRRWAPFTPRGADVDVVLDLMIHDLDVALALVDAPIRAVQAHGVSIVSPTTDVAHARVVFHNGCAATFSANRLAESKVREIRVFEPASYLVVDLVQQTAVIGRRAMGTSGSPQVLTELVRGDGQEPLKLELEAFLKAVGTGTPPLVSGQDGTAALELAYAIIDEIATDSHRHR